MKIHGFLRIVLILALKSADAVNGVMVQYFDWYLPANGQLWNNLEQDAEHLRFIGVTAVWIPPAYKGFQGKSDVGYGVYDKYDLGEFYQKDTIATKYGYLVELKSAIDKLHTNQIQVYGDIVINHIIGADETEAILVNKVATDNRNYIYPNSYQQLHAWTKFTFPGRHGKYSNFTYNYKFINGIDGEVATPLQSKNNIYLLVDHAWSNHVDKENQNYDYLLGVNLDYSIPQLRDEVISWGKWYTDTLKLDGYRIDAVKHIDARYIHDWLSAMRSYTGREMFSVGEYWNGDVKVLNSYEKQVNFSMSLFDVPLHYNFYAASHNPDYDLRQIFNNTLLQDNPGKAVTFVDNHDTQPGQSLQSFVAEWFKPIAYAIILTREQGYPNLFYADYYGSPGDGKNLRTKINSLRDKLDPLLIARKNYAYGKQHDYLSNPNKHYIGWTREGGSFQCNGLATIISTAPDREGYMDMYIGQKGEAFTKWRDITGNYTKFPVILQTLGNGWIRFPVQSKSVSIWVPDC